MAPIESSVLAYYQKISAKLGEGESIQRVHSNCTHLSYHVFAESSSATLVLQPEGPCERSLLSRITIHISVKNCTVGFEQLKDRCICDRRLLRHLNNISCSIDTLSITGKGSGWMKNILRCILTVLWITVILHPMLSASRLQMSSVLIIAVKSYVVLVKTITALLWEAPNAYAVPTDILSFG